MRGEDTAEPLLLIHRGKGVDEHTDKDVEYDEAAQNDPHDEEERLGRVVVEHSHLVDADRVASLNAALAAAAALNEAQATTARVVGDASAPVERWWWQGIF